MARSAARAPGAGWACARARGQGKGGVLKKTKNRRRTLRKQVMKVEAALTTLEARDADVGDGESQDDESLEKANIENPRREGETSVYAGGAGDGGSVKTGVKRKRQAGSSCRTCGKFACQGTCWGIWREEKDSH